MLYNEFTAMATDLFLHHSTHPTDLALAWKVRLQRLIEETHDLRKTKADVHTSLILKGIESQLDEWEPTIPPDVRRQHTVHIGILTTRIFIVSAPLLKFPALKSHGQSPSAEAENPTPERLLRIVPHLHGLFEYFLALPAAEINAFSGPDWGSLILAIVVGYRISFPLPDMPEWDGTYARGVIRFSEYADRLCRMGGEAGKFCPSL